MSVEKNQEHSIPSPITAAEASYLTDDQILELARRVALKRLAQGPAITKPKAAHRYLQAIFATHECEVFAVLYLNSQHQVITYREHFFGTLDGAAVYPREIVKAALALNAGALLLAHNHPSGNSTPSHADVGITKRIRDAMALVDIRVLDHIVVSPSGCTSLAERGWI